MKKKRATQQEFTQEELDVWRDKALNLINNKLTMVLATSMENAPWATPVYYLYKDAAFYFFSSANSRHSRQVLSGGSAASAIYADGDRLDQIEGLQMSGAIIPVVQPAEKLSVAARYLLKFPLAKALLGDAGSAMDLLPDTNLYRFDPKKVYYMDNRSGFGKRLEIKL